MGNIYLLKSQIMPIITIGKKNFATSIGKIYDSIEKKPTMKFFVIPENMIPIDEGYDFREYFEDNIMKMQIEKDNNFRKLSLRANISIKEKSDIDFHQEDSSTLPWYVLDAILNSQNLDRSHFTSISSL